MRIHVFLFSLLLKWFSSAAENLAAKNSRDASNFVGTFDDVKEDVRVDSIPLRSFTVESAQACIDHCLQHGECKSTNMNEDLGQCELLSVSLSHDPSIETSVEPGWLYRGFIKIQKRLIHRQQNTMTAEEKMECYEDQPDPNNLPEEHYCVRPFFFDDKIHKSCSQQCQTERMVPIAQDENVVCVTGIIGSTPSNRGMSCKAIKEKCRRTASGKYYIRLTSGVKKLTYCDMETDGGGWLLIANLNITDRNPLPDNIEDIGTELTGMESIADGENMLLEATSLKEIMDAQNTKELRIQCTKEWHQRKLHIVIDSSIPTGDEILNYIKDPSDISYGLCPKPFRKLNDDNSEFAKTNCTWFSKITETGEMILYGPWIFFAGHTNILLGWNSRYECDDMTNDNTIFGYTIFGTWKYYIR